jgi:hypothetical protein
MADPIWNGLARLLPRGTKIGSSFHFCQTSSTQKQYEGPTVKQSQFPSVSPISKDPRECKYEKKKGKCESLSVIPPNAARSPKTMWHIYTNLLKGSWVPYWTRPHGVTRIRNIPDNSSFCKIFCDQPTRQNPALRLYRVSPKTEHEPARTKPFDFMYARNREVGR